jgi:hypothetical protein
MIEFSELEDGWAFKTSEAKVGLVSLGYELRIVLYAEGGESIAITISTAFEVSRGGTPNRLDPEESDPRLGELLLALRGRPLRACFARKRGALTLEFADDLRVDVSPDNHYEAWGVETDRLKLVAVPGGEVAVWER